jgi:hypothetical protein
MHLPRSKIARPGTADFRIVFARNDTRCKCVFLLSSPAWRARTSIEHNQQSDLAGKAANAEHTPVGEGPIPSDYGLLHQKHISEVEVAAREIEERMASCSTAARIRDCSFGWLNTATHEQHLPSPKQTRAAISAACTVMYSGMAEHLQRVRYRSLAN